MIYKPSSEERKALRQIASFYGCKVKFSQYEGGRWMGKYIELGTAYSKKRFYSLFCHELGHFINSKTGRYPHYHTTVNYVTVMNRMSWSLDQYVSYALKAEIFTEKVGKAICKEWFPGVKYSAYYKRTKYCEQFLYGYYL